MKEDSTSVFLLLSLKSWPFRKWKCSLSKHINSKHFHDRRTTTSFLDLNPRGKEIANLFKLPNKLTLLYLPSQSIGSHVHQHQTRTTLRLTHLKPLEPFPLFLPRFFQQRHQIAFSQVSKTSLKLASYTPLSSKRDGQTPCHYHQNPN